MNPWSRQTRYFEPREPREPRRLLSLLILSLFATILAACSGDPTPPRDLLLGPDDFPGQAVTETAQETGETSLDDPAVQVELNGPDFILLESLVLFQTEDQARNVLGAIKGDQILEGVTHLPVAGFEDNTGIMEDHLGESDALTLFFVQGRALVRITLAGEDRAEKVWEIAAKAREKSRNQ